MDLLKRIEASGRGLSARQVHRPCGLVPPAEAALASRLTLADRPFVSPRCYWIACTSHRSPFRLCATRTRG
jgi:hypothetical protein